MLTFEDMLAIVQPHNDKLIAEGRMAELLAALKESHRALSHYEWYAVDANGVRAKNEAAIAKAEGRAP